MTHQEFIIQNLIPLMDETGLLSIPGFENFRIHNELYNRNVIVTKPKHIKNSNNIAWYVYDDVDSYFNLGPIKESIESMCNRFIYGNEKSDHKQFLALLNYYVYCKRDIKLDEFLQL